MFDTQVTDRPKLTKWLRCATLTVIASVPALALAIAVRAYRSESLVFRPHRHAVPRPEGEHALAGLESVNFRDPQGFARHGWYVPSHNRAAVVLTHGSGGDRRDVLAEARLLTQRGFGVLLFDWPGHGESEGEIHWNEGERVALRAALDFLSGRAEVASDRLGAFGFSLGGHTVAQVAADDTRLRAVALAGTPPDPAQQTRWEYRAYGPLSQLPALWAVKRGGMPLDRLRPQDVVARIAPRPLFVIGGADDTSVPPFMAEQLFAAARQPKELLVVPGVGHGEYARSPAYRERLATFFEGALLPTPRSE